ncbi:MAG TPA: ATP-binding protein [Candidatus Obscuribacter sp.]|nr:ATP-binding protein [Candidatus Obscuribacter sp.]
MVVGASGVGKTTLVDALAPRLNLPGIPEIARVICRERGIKKLSDIPQSEQEEFKFAVLKRQIEEEEKEKNFLCDRSTLDAWVLWQRWNICQAMTYDTEKFYRLAREQAGKYSHIIYIPPVFTPPEDGFRWTNPDYQRQVDRLVRMTLYEWDLWPSTCTIKSSTPETRVEEALHWLQANSRLSQE